MSDEQEMSSFNVLNGSDMSKVIVGSWDLVGFDVKTAEFGTPYTLSVTCDSSADKLTIQTRFNYWTTDGKPINLSATPSVELAKGKHVATLAIPSFGRPDDFKSAYLIIQAGDISGKGTIEISRPMLVEGTEPAAWAPAEGENLAGGGAQMSANLWQAESVISSETQEGGIYACSGTRGVRTNVTLDRLAENQTFHCGFSVNPGADDAFNLALLYKDAAGHVNYAFTPDASAPAGKWTRVSKSVVVPSCMTVYQIVIYNTRNASGASGWKVMNPTLSFGSPVCLASSAHTPYATQDHVSAVYATKASLKVTDDAVTSEVSARAQTDRNVADLSSRLTQTANSLTSEISDRRSAITTVTGLANAAQSTADAAKSSASSAVSTANSASTSAANAVKTANSASSAASSASTTASKASTDAAAAVNTANAASSTASSAATTANSAKSTANSAASTANAAQTMATENQSSIKQLSDSITSEVSARTETDRTVSDLSSRLTQTASGLSASISKLSETDEKVNAWFDFEADASGKPQLKMGSSTSPVVGTYTNSGLAYRSRDGATIMELDASRSATISDHVEVQDMKVGKWKWVQTQDGTHLTLVWAG